MGHAEKQAKSIKEDSIENPSLLGVTGTSAKDVVVDVVAIVTVTVLKSGWQHEDILIYSLEPRWILISTHLWIQTSYRHSSSRTVIG